MAKKILNNDFQFLLKISEIFSVEYISSNIIPALKKVFKSYTPFDNIEIMVWDENILNLRNFVEDREIRAISEKTTTWDIIFANLSSTNNYSFCFNQETIKFPVTEEESCKIMTAISEDNNIFTFPLMVKNEVYGIINLYINKIEDNLIFDSNFFNVIKIAIGLISSSISNYILKEQMDISLNFYSAMKDIAKIIESQYDLLYIVPLIGEMIDRFIPAHLIYIFIINKDGKYELLWPNACKDKEVYKLLDKINYDSEYIISEDYKIGIFPLIYEKNILGAIVAYSNIDILMQKEIDYLVQLTKQSTMTIQRANMYAEVLQHATLDALTGLNNRHQFEVRLGQEISNAKRKNSPLCAIMIDVDYFKKVNDTYGHAAGDCVLKAVSKIMTDTIREYDIPCRYGGEEFFIILPQTKIEEASAVAKRLLKTISETKIDISSAKIPKVNFIKVTVSIGVTNYEQSLTSDDFCHNADKALYEAKENGRNKVIVQKI